MTLLSSNIVILRLLIFLSWAYLHQMAAMPMSSIRTHTKINHQLQLNTYHFLYWAQKYYWYEAGLVSNSLKKTSPNQVQVPGPAHNNK